MNCEISLAAQVDAQQIAEMSRRLVEYGLPESWGVPRVVRHIRATNSVVIKACNASTLLGFAIMGFDDEAAHLNLLAVEPDYRRRNIGRRLLTWLEESAITAGTFFVSLEVRAHNRTARNFYAELGYDETGKIEGYYSGVEDAIVFARDLRIFDTERFD